MKNTFVLTLFSMLISVVAMAANPAVKVSAEDQKNLQNIMKPYQKAPFTQMKVEKKTQSEFSGKEKVYQGSLFVAPNKLRWEQTQPEKNLIVFDGKTVWNESQIDPELPVVVTKSAVNKNNEDQIIFLKMLKDPKWLDAFEITKVSKVNDKETTYSLKQKDKQKKIAVQTFDLLVKNKAIKGQNYLLIQEINFTDDIGNKTLFSIQETIFSESSPKGLFSYTPPKDAEVSNL